MAFYNVNTIDRKGLWSLYWGNWILSLHTWRHRSVVKEVDIHLLPAPKLIYRRGGSVRMLKLGVSWGIWTADVALFHGHTTPPKRKTD